MSHSASPETLGQPQGQDNSSNLHPQDWSYLNSEPSEISAVRLGVDENPETVDRFIVCGLGSLGQHCVAKLQSFAVREAVVHVTAIDKVMPEAWETPELEHSLTQELVIGDCRRDEVLEQAGVRQCRAILLVTSDESVNIAAAIAARKLNPQTRLIIRSSKQNLNQLLKQQLGNLAALEPTELPAAAFALAGLGRGTLGFFSVEGYRFRVVERQVQPGDSRFDRAQVHQLFSKTYRLLSLPDVQLPDMESASGRSFFQWPLDYRIRAGERVIYVESAEQISHTGPQSSRPSQTQRASFWSRIKLLRQSYIRAQLTQFWQWLQAEPTRQVVVIGLVIGLALLLTGILLLNFTLFKGQEHSWQHAFSSSVILLLGGYGDVFGGLEPTPAPLWVQLYCLMITGFSLLFFLGVVGLIADQILSTRLVFRRQRFRLPKEDHIVLVGLGRIGQRVAQLLQQFKQPVVGVTDHPEQLDRLPQMPLVAGDPVKELAKTNLATAKSIIVATDDQMLNLEIALMAREAARAVNRQVGLVIRTYDQQFSDSLAKLLPDAQALCANALVAEAFAGAAFGENILGLFRLPQRTILITEYTVAAGDTLAGKLLAEVAYGYGVAPIFYQRFREGVVQLTTIMPSDDLRLQEGDRLVVLASINGLRRVERGDLAPAPLWLLEIVKQAPNQEFLLEAGNVLTRISGCSLEAARNLMQNLPGKMPLHLYDLQAQRLRTELSRLLPVSLTLEQRSLQ